MLITAKGEGAHIASDEDKLVLGVGDSVDWHRGEARLQLYRVHREIHNRPLPRSSNGLQKHRRGQLEAACILLPDMGTTHQMACHSR